MPISTVAALDVNLPILPNKRKLVLSFQSGMNQGIDAVNRLIVDYGESNDFEKKTRIFQKINFIFLKMCVCGNYFSRILESYKSFRKLQKF